MPSTEIPSTHRKRNIFFHADFNLPQLLQLAERLRRQPCNCDDSQTPKAGALNWAIFLKFDDGVEWVFRAPCSTYSVTRAAAERLFASEAATLKYIREHTSIPVPEVFHYSSNYENDIGIPYILMSKAAGDSLAKYGWRTNSSVTPVEPMTEEGQKRIMRQLGGYARQLSGLRFPVIGSLFEGDEGYYIGECLSPGHVLHDRETVVDLPRGPFDNDAAYYLSLATALRAHAEQLPMGHHVLRAPVPIQQEYTNFAKYYAATDRWNDFVSLGGMVESSVNRLQYCLLSHLLRDSIVPLMVPPMNRSASGFPLHHHDISLQNLFVDDNLNITCVIDWAFSSTVPPAQLLATPGLPHPRDLVLDSSLVDAFRSGFESDDGRIAGQRIEPDCWKVGDMVSRFMRLVNLDALQDYRHSEELFALYRELVTPGDDDEDASLSAMLAAQATTQEAVALAGDFASDDEPEGEIRRREKEYFFAVGSDMRLAVAQKVALAAAMNPHFVADERLWRWVDAVMECYGDIEPNVCTAKAKDE